jgi:4-amino-4-deoxy-L-arabinose transferase-like glycosyltransferase
MAAWLRLWHLAEVPPGFWYDEAYEAMDALWMLDTGQPQIFFVGNNGREPMMAYLGALSMSLLGATPYSLRLVSALAGILTIPLMYRWLTYFWADNPANRWLGLIAAAGLTFSFWHLMISRTGYRVALFPLFFILTIYLFWLGWRRQSLWYFAGAGLALGLSQYTYLSARLQPFVFIVFVAASTIIAKPGLGSRWLSWASLLTMIIVASVVFLPLGLFFLDNSAILSERANQVFVLNSIAKGETTLIGHLLEALSVFIDGSDPNWRHNPVGQPVFDGLSLVGFGMGLLVTIKRFRYPPSLFLLISLFVMWLPSMLSVPAVNALRLSGVLPIYYAIMAVGLLVSTDWLAQRLPWQAAIVWARPVLFVLVLIISGGLTTSNYFVRWANDPMVYKQYEGPLVDL